MTRSDTELSRPAGLSPVSPTAVRRRNTRSMTLRTMEDFQDYQVRPGWQPGSEPGIDTTKPDGGHAALPFLHTASQITVVDFSQTDITMQRLDNRTLPGFLEMPPPPWKKCRWINVNGLSWDVIQALGNHKKLHRLSIEDLLNTRNRTKADWYGPVLSSFL